MKKYDVIYESIECISGYVHPTKEWIEYSGVLTIKNGGKQPVTLEMTFIPPHPYNCNMPLRHSIKAQSVTDIKFLFTYYFALLVLPVLFQTVLS